MKNPNPIIPPGMNLDKSRRGRSNMRIAVVVIVMVHIALFGLHFVLCLQSRFPKSEKYRAECPHCFLTFCVFGSHLG